MSKRGVAGLGALGALLGLGAYGLLGAGTTPIGTATELAAWPQGRADAPFCVAYLGAPIGCIYADGGASGSLIPHSAGCPFDIKLVDGGQLFDFGCDSSINQNASPNTGNPFLVFSNGAMFVGPFVQGSNSLADGGGASFTVASDLGQSLGTLGLPGMEATLPLYNASRAAHLSWDGTSWILDRPTYDKDYVTSDAGFCFNDHTCQTSAASSPALPLTLTNGTVTAKFQAKNGGLWLGSSSAHDLYLGTSDGFGFLQGNATGISLYAPVEMGGRQITGLGAATTAAGAAIRNQTILVTDPASGSQQPVMAHGKITLSTGTGNHTFAVAFSAAPDCTWGDNSAVLASSCSATASAITCTGTGSDVVSYICVGLP